MIVDAFTFLNEKELVELRIKYLNELVDCFLIVEADVTHTGKEKKWNFSELLNNNLKENYNTSINCYRGNTIEILDHLIKKHKIDNKE